MLADVRTNGRKNGSRYCAMPEPARQKNGIEKKVVKCLYIVSHCNTVIPFVRANRVQLAGPLHSSLGLIKLV